MRDVSRRAVIFGRIGSAHKSVKRDVMIRQHQALSRNEFARAVTAAKSHPHNRVFDTWSVWVVDVCDRDSQSTLLELRQRKLIQRVRKEHAFIAED